MTRQEYTARKIKTYLNSYGKCYEKLYLDQEELKDCMDALIETERRRSKNHGNEDKGCFDEH